MSAGSQTAAATEGFGCADSAAVVRVAGCQASRILVSSESDFESTVGYSRAVRVGPHVAVAGTTGTGPPATSPRQTRDALRRIEIALHEAGASLTDVVRTRIYVTDISRWHEVAVPCTPRCSAISGRRPPWSKCRR